MILEPRHWICEKFKITSSVKEFHRFSSTEYWNNLITSQQKPLIPSHHITSHPAQRHPFSPPRAPAPSPTKVRVPGHVCSKYVQSPSRRYDLSTYTHNLPHVRRGCETRRRPARLWAFQGGSVPKRQTACATITTDDWSSKW